MSTDHPATLVATDLDRTLIYSRAAIDPQSTDAQRSSATEPPLLCVELLEGQPISFMTVAAAGLLERIRTLAELVPTTTRTLAQFERVALPGGPTRFAVVSNGGHIVVDGAVDAQWRRTVESRLAIDGAGLVEIVSGLEQQAAGPWVLNRKVADNLFCYLVVDLVALPTHFLGSWTSWCADRGWVVSMQGRKIYALPRGLTKQAALTEVLTRTGARRLLAAGDGALDAGFLSLADRAIRPPHGELAETGWLAAHVDVAEASGVLAGEEMCQWMIAQLQSSAAPTVR